ncbi:hypothetical protein BS50DRAFT_610587 [Corynespora cassiicola Philippines]|uniref:Protein kinase domain-containing protein n=1 Tax=Corynespora cassiicola Philippines TaxID=1448308 RepID=A0A2T2NQF5_CORCC|nr:hypothetical protein BS50DRAFT_610587 [Corynespora cassiicola Philippines]
MAELSLAAVSLTFQVFSGCVQGYQLITDAKHMPSDCQYLRVRLKTEQYRLLDWADVVRLDDTDESLLINNQSKGLLLDVLHQQHQLLYHFGRFDDKYRTLSKPLLVDAQEENNGILPSPPAYSPTDEGPESPTLEKADTGFQRRFPQSKALLNKSLGWAKSSKYYPRRLRWAVFDRAKMEQLVLKLTGFNDFMREMLNATQLEMLVEKQTRTEFQIMQLNSSVQDLIQIVHSTSLKSQSNRRRARYPNDPIRSWMHSQGFEDHDEEADGTAPRMHNLAALAQFKALNSAIEDPNLFTDEFTSQIELHHTASEIISVELSRKDIHILSSDPSDDSEFQRVEAYYQPPRSKKTSVWIEWKAYEPMNFQTSEPDPKIHERVKGLAALLKENSSRDHKFRAPHCLGYFQDTDPATGEDHYRFGLVFEKPSSAHPSTRPMSLHALLTDEALAVPSLTDRVALMRCLSETIERLHAVNWLHKGLRSANILFFSDCGPEDVPFGDPFVSGFDYSRPAQNDDLTEKPPENAALDIYRHPRVQGSGNRESPHNSFKKSYDLYALGIILLEIAYWRPIEKILGIENLANARPSITMKVSQRLLSEEEGFLGYVRSHLGNMVHDVVKACLEGPKGFGLEEGVDEKKEEVGAELQRMFYEKVVKEFGNMRV